jgi:hypothetical protein
MTGQPADESAAVPEELVLTVAKATSSHFVMCDFGASWRDCRDCTKIANSIGATLKAALPAHEAMVRAKVAEEIEETRAEWNAGEPEGPNSCGRADVHNCHRVGGETAFEETLRIIRGETR